MSLQDDRLIYEQYAQMVSEADTAPPAPGPTAKVAPFQAHGPGAMVTFAGPDGRSETYTLPPNHRPVQGNAAVTALNVMNQQGVMAQLQGPEIDALNQQIQAGTVTVQQAAAKQQQQQQGGEAAVKGDPKVNPEAEAAWATPAHGVVQGADIGASDSLSRWAQGKVDAGISSLAKKGKDRANAAVAY